MGIRGAVGSLFLVFFESVPFYSRLAEGLAGLDTGAQPWECDGAVLRQEEALLAHPATAANGHACSRKGTRCDRAHLKQRPRLEMGHQNDRCFEQINN